jgi:hypothetical protein
VLELLGKATLAVLLKPTELHGVWAVVAAEQRFKVVMRCLLLHIMVGKVVRDYNQVLQAQPFIIRAVAVVAQAVALVQEVLVAKVAVALAPLLQELLAKPILAAVVEDLATWPMVVPVDQA